MRNHTLLITLLSGFLLSSVANAQLPATEQGFDDLEKLSPGWIRTNQSTPLGISEWAQGNPTLFIAQRGSGDSYISANFNNTGGAPNEPGTICNYLIMPDLGNLATMSFHSRSRIAGNNFNIFPDRLYVVYSPTGEINTGNCTDGFGDFTETLLVINPELSQDPNPPNGYPLNNWFPYELEINGAGRIAFVYYVEDAGFYGTNSNIVGIDTVQWEFADPE